jgi:hypothetical protein
VIPCRPLSPNCNAITTAAGPAAANRRTCCRRRMSRPAGRGVYRRRVHHQRRRTWVSITTDQQHVGFVLVAAPGSEEPAQRSRNPLRPIIHQRATPLAMLTPFDSTPGNRQQITSSIQRRMLRAEFYSCSGYRDGKAGAAGTGRPSLCFRPPCRLRRLSVRHPVAPRTAVRTGHPPVPRAQISCRTVLSRSPFSVPNLRPASIVCPMPIKQ